MGVLIPGPDMTAVRRTAAFFLNNFQDRLEEQKRDAAANPDYDASFKGPRSKEDKKAVRKQILSSIGAGSPSLLPRSSVHRPGPDRCGMR